MSDSIFAFHQLTKSFKDQVALDEVSFSGERGQVVALLGENGAGKTTAISILQGTLLADSGTASVLGMDSRTQGLEIRKRIGYVPDQPALYDWMSVEETGWFASGFYEHGYYNRYTDIIRSFHVPLGKKVKSLSKGMKAKVSLALSLALEPQLLVLDEPTSGLDPLVRREFLESMVDVAAQDRTVLLSSHQVSEVERVADVVVILIKGKVVVNDSLETLKEQSCEAVITGGNGAFKTEECPGRVVHREADGNQQKLMILGAEPKAVRAFLEQQPDLIYEIRSPSLEDLLLQLLQSSRLEQDKLGAEQIESEIPSVSSGEQRKGD